MTKLWSGHEIDCLAKSVILTLVVQTWHMRAAHRLIMVNISTKLFQIPSMNDKYMERTRN